MLIWMGFFSRGFCRIQDFKFQTCNEKLHQNSIFQAQISLLNAEFPLSLPLVLFLFSQIFLYFSLHCGGRNVGNNDEQSREMDGKVMWLCSHELSAIAELQHLNGFSRLGKHIEISLCYTLSKFQRGKKNTGTVNAKLRHNILLPE
jgi:hypothetical protein